MLSYDGYDGVWGWLAPLITIIGIPLAAIAITLAIGLLTH